MSRGRGQGGWAEECKKTFGKEWGYQGTLIK